jgi:hypothetical protein
MAKSVGITVAIGIATTLTAAVATIGVDRIRSRLLALSGAD